MLRVSNLRKRSKEDGERMSEKKPEGMPAWAGNQKLVCPSCGAKHILGGNSAERKCDKCGTKLGTDVKAGTYNVLGRRD
jgi:uncharacterized protein (DUF983 family)